MAAEKDTDVNKQDRSVPCDPDFFVEKLCHERPEAFTELVLSNITRLFDLPGAEFSQLLGDEEPKTPNGTTAGGFFCSFNFLKRKDKGVVFSMPLTEEGVAQIYQLIMFLSKTEFQMYSASRTLSDS